MCNICKFAQPLANRQDVVGMKGGAGVALQNQGGPPQGWGGGGGGGAQQPVQQGGMRYG